MMKTTSCIACGKAIDPKAKLCAECGSYQSSSMNWLLFVSKVAAGLSVLAAASLYVITASYQFYEKFAGFDKLDMISFSSYDTAVILNEGDGKVFVSDVYTRVPGSGEFITQIYNTIGPGSLLSVSPKPEVKEILEKYKVLAGDPFRKWIEQRRGGSHDETACVVVAAFSEKDPKFQLYAKHYGNTPFFTVAESQLNYYSLMSKKSGALVFPSKAVYLVNPRCREDFESTYGKSP